MYRGILRFSRRNSINLNWITYIIMFIKWLLLCFREEDVQSQLGVAKHQCPPLHQQLEFRRKSQLCMYVCTAVFVLKPGNLLHFCKFIIIEHRSRQVSFRFPCCAVFGQKCKWLFVYLGVIINYYTMINDLWYLWLIRDIISTIGGILTVLCNIVRSSLIRHIIFYGVGLLIQRTCSL